MSRLPFLFIITGMIGFVLFHGLSIFSLFDWMEGSLRGPSGWFHIHLFVLGWATMLAMGAVYQLIHVILQSKIYSENLGYVHYVVFTTGLIGLLYGFAKMEFLMIGMFASIATLGILLFAWNMAVTLFRARIWDSITISAACAVLYLVATAISGMVMGINFIHGEWNLLHENIFGAHIWLGTIGWFGLLITGFSYKMLPMFYLAHHYPTRLQKITLLLWNIAVLGGAAAFLFGGRFWAIWSAVLVLIIAIIFYTIHLLQIKKHRMKRSPGKGIAWSVYASQALLVISILMLIYTFFAQTQLLNEKSITIAGWMYIAGWVSFTILCYASKIIPFLWWTMKYGKLAGKAGVPLMADMLSEKKASILLAAIAICTVFVMAGFILEANIVIVISGLAYSLFSVAYMILLGLTFTR